MLEGIFGNKTASRVLLYIVNYGEGNISGIAATFGMAKSQVRKQLLRLEGAGVLIGRDLSNLRVFTLNPRYPLKTEIETLVEKALTLLPEEETQRFFRQRRRPRRTGKLL